MGGKIPKKLTVLYVKFNLKCWEWPLKSLYSFVALIHYLFRKPLLKSSFEQKSHWKWDFLFYSLFGVLITSSVQVAGVLLVFSFLIVPAVLSSLFSFKTFFSRLLFGWLAGLILSLLGLGLSYYLDLPAGGLIVVVFTLTLMLLLPFRKSERRTTTTTSLS